MEKRLHAKWISILRSLVLIATVTGLALGSVACHTIKGMGRDVRSLGRGVEEVSGVENQP